VIGKLFRQVDESLGIWDEGAVGLDNAAVSVGVEILLKTKKAEAG